MKSVFKLIVLIGFLVSIYVIYNNHDKVVTLNKENPKLLLIPYHGVSEKDELFIKNTLEDFYNLKVVINEGIELPKETFINVKSPRYRADKLIKWQKSLLKDYNYVLGFTHTDISTTKNKEPKSKYEDWGVMGLAYCPANSCIISSFRLKNRNQKVYEDRLKKVIVHELGHNLGLKHCSDKSCLMTDAVETVNTIDNANFSICNTCKKQINHFIKK